MGYVGSYMWKLRQKVGRDMVLTPTVDVLPIDSEDRIKLVLTFRVGLWTLAGGHVEPGDSWGAGAIKELEEEAGIVADKRDLELFATISGPGRIYHYQDGDTQPFTNVYLIRKWSDERAPSDMEEVQEAKWVSLAEAKSIGIDNRTARILEAYEVYLKTGKVQTIEE